MTLWKKEKILSLFYDIMWKKEKLLKICGTVKNHKNIGFIRTLNPVVCEGSEALHIFIYCQVAELNEWSDIEAYSWKGPESSSSLIL